MFVYIIQPWPVSRVFFVGKFICCLREAQSPFEGGRGMTGIFKRATNRFSLSNHLSNFQ